MTKELRQVANNAVLLNNEKKALKGFSKLSKIEKINLIAEEYFSDPASAKIQFKKFWLNDEATQRTIDEFSENTLTNFSFPFGVVPNVKINGQIFCVPMVIEESSVVAASAKAANFWLSRGGFKATVLGVKKVGQVHFIWHGDNSKLQSFFESKKV